MNFFFYQMFHYCTMESRKSPAEWQNVSEIDASSWLNREWQKFNLNIKEILKIS